MDRQVLIGNGMSEGEYSGYTPATEFKLSLFERHFDTWPFATVGGTDWFVSRAVIAQRNSALRNVAIVQACDRHGSLEEQQNVFLLFDGSTFNSLKYKIKCTKDPRQTIRSVSARSLIRTNEEEKEHLIVQMLTIMRFGGFIKQDGLAATMCYMNRGSLYVFWHEGVDELTFCNKGFADYLKSLVEVMNDEAKQAKEKEEGPTGR